MTQPNQHSFTRSQIRQWAKTGLLTPERIAAIEDAVKRGQVHNDIGGAPAPDEPGPPAKPQAAGTEIPGRTQLPRMPWWW